MSRKDGKKGAGKGHGKVDCDVEPSGSAVYIGSKAI